MRRCSRTGWGPPPTRCWARGTRTWASFRADLLPQPYRQQGRIGRRLRSGRFSFEEATIFTTLQEKLTPAHTALIVIDMQNDFCDDEGASAQNGADLRVVQAIVPSIHQLADTARQAGATVIFVR